MHADWIKPAGDQGRGQRHGKDDIRRCHRHAHPEDEAGQSPQKQQQEGVPPGDE